MALEFDTCYRAVVARDPRFDGRFFTGVTSTGIYCRPICPARTPARHNLRFFPHAGAAEAAGFRACRRCRPEASPGSPDWNARADLAARAVKLIADGYADEHGISGLARRLAVTERHLRRLLLAELGATPIALARTTRLQTARRLLAETDMPVTEIAFASGFASVRQFNASFRDAYGRPPTALRTRTPRPGRRPGGAARPGAAATGGKRVPDGQRAAGQVPGTQRATGQGVDTQHAAGQGVDTRRAEGPGVARQEPSGDVAADGTWLTLRLACRQPFDGRSLLQFLAARAIAGVEEVARGRYARTVRVPGGSGLVELVPPPAAGGGNGRAAPAGRTGGAQVLLRVRLTGLRGIGQVVSRCRRLFDLDADPQAIAAALAADEALAPLVAARPGLRVPGAYDGFELAVRAVIGQQVSVPAASTLTGRLAARHGTRLDGTAGPAGPLSVLFPRPADLADADLAGLGITTARQVTLRALAAACAAGRLNLDPGADPEETAARLVELPGVGPWTVAYILMRTGDPDAFPGSDLGLRRAMERLGLEPGRADRWRPWRAYAALHLWAALAGPPGVAELATESESATRAEPATQAAPATPAEPATQAVSATQAVPVTQTVSPGPAGPSAYGRGAGTSSVMPAVDLAATGQE
jgi:AraC family transcriptional regulator, regulatory protein of adaptative response / DNA-3-methyladenine glycosylase II